MNRTKTLEPMTAMIDFQASGNSTEQKDWSFVDVLELQWRIVPNM